MSDPNFRSVIMDLISLQQEGGYWDFKEKWYSDNADLLLDIICLANNLQDRDAYIIIGVKDNDCSIVGTQNDPNRKNTQNIVDFLRTKKFAGENRPTVTVEPLLSDDGIEFDVIVVHNSLQTPFYLTEREKGLCPYHVYTRVQDTNTPRNSSADISHVEYLWKKRFGLLLSPLEKMRLYLHKPQDWDTSPSIEQKKYYRFAPEFTIEYSLDDDRDGYEYFLFSQTDHTPRWTVFKLMYHQTVLQELGGVILDGGRCVAATPDWDGISLSDYHQWDISYRYMIKNNLCDIICHFYQYEEGSDAYYALHHYLACVLVFESEEEHQLFNHYARYHWGRDSDQIKQDIHIPYIPNIEGQNHYKEQYLNVQVLQRLLSQFRCERASSDSGLF